MQLGSNIRDVIYLLSGASTEAALTIAIPVAVIGEFMSVIMRIIIAQFSHVAEIGRDRRRKLQKAQNIHIWWSFGLNCAVYFVPIF